MSLKPIRGLDLLTLLTGGNYNGNQKPDSGVSAPAPNNPFAYYDRLGFYYSEMVTGQTGTQRWLRLDPLFLDNTSPTFGVHSSPSSPIYGSVHIGDWNKTTNQQNVFIHIGAGPSTLFQQANPLDFTNIITANAYPNTGVKQHQGSLISTDPGYYNNAEGDWVFFDQDQGIAINTNADCIHTDTVNKFNVMISVDLATGHATILPITVSYGTIHGHEFEGPPLFGSTTQMRCLQFIPDSTSTPGAPKGQFLMHSQPFLPTTGSEERAFLQFVDWNPMGVGGTPSRTHQQITLVSAIEVINADWPANPNSLIDSANQHRIRMNPNTGQLNMMTVSGAGGTIIAGGTGALFFSPVPELDLLSAPSELEQVVSAKTISFGVDARGDLNEPITGLDVQFELVGVSSKGEVLADTDTPGETIAITNTPINDQSPVQVWKVSNPGGVRTDLVEGVDYSVSNYATGSILFVSPETQAGYDYFASYRHSATEITTPLGTLLNAVGVTDEGGQAVARVQYDDDDDLVPLFDRLKAEGTT